MTDYAAQNSHRLAAFIEPIARHYLSEPNAKLSKGDDLRFGTNGSMSVSLTKGTWFDHENGVGGGVIELVKKFEPASINNDIGDVLEKKFGIPKQVQRTLTTAKRLVRQYDYFNKNARPRSHQRSIQMIAATGAEKSIIRSEMFSIEYLIDPGIAKPSQSQTLP